MNNDYSFSIASLEIIIALSAAFIIGALLCYLLRLIGRLFRGKTAEPETIPAQHAQPNTTQVNINRTPVNSGYTAGNTRNEQTGFQAAFPEPRHPSPPVIERQPIPQPEPTPVNRLVEGGSTYEADIDTLLRRGNSSSQHAVTLPQGNRNHDMDASFASRARESLNSPAPRDPVVSPVRSDSNNDLYMPADDHIDDLKKLEGIGPNIERLLNQYGIKSYARLATLSRDQLRDVLAAGGNEFKMHDPKSWPYQAELAAKQNWERLREYQEFLIEGRNR